MTAFGRGQYSQAAALFRQELAQTESVDVREKLVLSLYEAGWKAEAKAEYLALRKRYPSHRFDPLQVLPEVKADLETMPEGAPTVVKLPPPPPAKRPWHWYYLAPLGIGQFLAKSPVRGALFVSLEVAFIAANVAGAILLGQRLRKDGTVDALAPAVTAQVVMDVGFFGLIGTLIAAAVDGAVFE